MHVIGRRHGIENFWATNNLERTINGFEEFSATLGECWVQPQRDRFGHAILSDEDVADAFGDALESPFGYYPPLTEAVFPGDTVAIVLQDKLPRSRLLLDCLLKRLMVTNVEPTEITVVVSPATAKSFGLELKQKSSLEEGEPVETESYFPLDDDFQSIQFKIHDADNEHGVAYIAANEEGLPVKVNRAIVDADVILPIGCPDSNDPDGLVDCIYPTFCNAETQARFRQQKGSIAERRAEIALANDHLGAFFTIQIIVGPGQQIYRIISGERTAAIELATTESNEAWRIKPVEGADMAIVTIETEQQSWKDFARAIVAANSLAVSSGPIFAWSNLNERPKSEIRKALNEPFESVHRAKLSRLMQQLADIVSERQVFLKSKLPQSITEELGLGYVDSVEDVSRLIANQSSGVLLRDAHRCHLTTELESQDA